MHQKNDLYSHIKKNVSRKLNINSFIENKTKIGKTFYKFCR